MSADPTTAKNPPPPTHQTPPFLSQSLWPPFRFWTRFSGSFGRLGILTCAIWCGLNGLGGPAVSWPNYICVILRKNYFIC